MKVPEPRKLKSGTYFIQLRLNGVSVPVTASTPTACKHKAELIKAEHRAGKRASERENFPTLGQAIDEYIESRSNVLSPSTLSGYRSYRRNRFQKYMDKPLNDIQWQKVVNEEARVIAPRYLRNAWGLVSSSVREYGFTPSVRFPALPPKEKEWLTAEQIPVFLAATKGKPGEVGALLALSSLRRSEIYGLRWENVDLKKKVIHVRESVIRGADGPVTRKQNKNATSTRDVPIFLPRLYDVLKASKQKTGKVVPGELGTLRRQIRAVCESAGLPDVGVHGLRHSFASLCYSIGVSEIGAMKIGGWSDYRTMRKIYTHLSDADQQKSAEKLTTFFEKC